LEFTPHDGRSAPNRCLTVAHVLYIIKVEDQVHQGPRAEVHYHQRNILHRIIYVYCVQFADDPMSRALAFGDIYRITHLSPLVL
jgi:hypothetical protein